MLALSIVACARPAPSDTTEVPQTIAVRFQGPAQPRALAAQRDPSMADCGRCHQAIALEHAASLHRASFENPIFSASYEQEPRPSCRHCHSPRGDESAGVDCATCHVRDGWVVGAYRRVGSVHLGPVDPTMAGVDACAGCHEFDFPDEIDLGLPPSHAPMQRTITEWSMTRAGLDNEACQSCHMPPHDGHLDHRFGVRRDPDRLRAGVVLSAHATHDERGLRVDVQLDAQGAGHAVPTGDIFRRLELVVEAGGVRHERVFARTFEPLSRVRQDGSVQLVRREVEDRRLFPADEGEPVPSFSFRFPSGGPARVTLDYLLMPDRLAELQNVAASVQRTRLYDVEIGSPDGDSEARASRPRDEHAHPAVP